MRVFISSTVYDLIDLRREVEQHLRDLDLTPVMSDSSANGFEVSQTEHSIETCLENVRSSDVFVIILCQRYGPTLEKIGYGDYSATHLEYLEAKKKGMRIHFYVRDSLIADYNIWKKTKTIDNCSWIDRKNKVNEKLLDFLHSHQELKEGSNNWYNSFNSSIELKSMLNRDFSREIGQLKIQQKMEGNQLPYLFVEMLIPSRERVDKFRGSRRAENKIELNLKLENTSNVIAHNIVISNRFEDVFKLRALPTRKPTPFFMMAKELPFFEKLFVSYTDGVGIEILDTYTVEFKFVKIGSENKFIIGASLKEKSYSYNSDMDEIL